MLIDAYIKNVWLCLVVEHGLYNKVSVFRVVPMRFFFFFFLGEFKSKGQVYFIKDQRLQSITSH